MLEPRHRRFSAIATSPIIGNILPTGKTFGGSNLNRIEGFQPILVSLDPNSSPVVERDSQIEERSVPLVIQVTKIVALACWLWCAIGADFCVNTLSAIASFGTQEV